jgi:hypothetical protein
MDFNDLNLDLVLNDKKSLKKEILERATSNLIAQGISPKVQACCFVNASDIIPEEITREFWSVLSENAPFSWGDNNKSLVCAIDLAHHLREIEDNFGFPTETLNAILQELDSLEETYVDLES